MLQRKNETVPPKWRTSLAVYAYAVPLAETAAEYPDDRIVYLKLSSSITGWTLRDDIPSIFPHEEELDDWQTDAWDLIRTSGPMSEYWPCLTAIAQIAIYPSDEETPDDDYPYFIDFEPKKRELYETVTETGEVLSSSSNKIGTQKGNTSTKSTEANFSLTGGVTFPIAPGVEGEVSATAGLGLGWGNGKSELSTSDASTERRETEGRTTQLSQLYQLFNGYHTGTNRAVFAIFARPHVVNDAHQVNVNLINGERQLEGVQDMFLVALVPRTMTGFCVNAWIDTAHKPRFDGGPHDARFLVTRRIVGGCADFDEDVIVPVPPETPPTEPPQIVWGEGELDPSPRLRSKRPGAYAMEGLLERVAAADTLNMLQADLRHRVLSFAASSSYKPRELAASSTFEALGYSELGRSAFSLADLVTLEYLTSDQRSKLEGLGIKSVRDLFSKQTDDSLVTEAQRTLWAAVAGASKAAAWPTTASECATAFGYGTWASAWLCDEALGDLSDSIGAISLTPVTSPQYRAAGLLINDYAVGFDSSTADGFHAASTTTYDLDASGSIAVYCCIRFTSMLNRQFAGKSGPVGNNYGIQLQSSPTGRIDAYVDSGSTVITSTVDVDHWQSGAGNWHDTLLCIDRVTQNIQAFTELGTSTAASISSVGTLTNVVPFGLGAPTSGTTAGCEIAFAAVATGGVDLIRANGAAVIHNIRRFTRRT